MSTRLLVYALRLAPAIFAAAFAGSSACEPRTLPASPSPPPTPPPPDRRPPPPPPAWTYWEAVDATVHGTATAPTLPLAEKDLMLVGAAAERWSALPEVARAAILERGFVVVPHATPTARFGQAYESLAEANVPYLVTLDALFWVAHVARDRALAATEDAVLAPALATLLTRLEARLASDGYGAPSDLLVPFVLARGVVSVAKSLLSPAYHPPVDLARVVAEENAKIAAHDGPSVSPLLGVTIDYSQIVPRGDADASAARAAYARAAAWLASAPLGFAARGEVAGAELSVSSARAHTRAALLLARLVDFNTDVETADAWHRWSSVADLMGGRADDMTLHGVLDAAAPFGIALPRLRAFVDVAKIDRLRHALVAGHASKLDDGDRRAAKAGDRDFVRSTTSARVFAPRGAADAEVLQALVFPAVGKLVVADGGAPESARDGIRALPRALDVGAWLGGTEARAALHDAGDDAYDGYDAALTALTAKRANEGQRHDSVYASSLDALATYLAPSAADASQPGVASPAWRRRKLEAALAGWTTLRHDALAFARFPLAPSAAPGDMHTHAPWSQPAFVEVHPEAIAKLVSLVRQTSRGLHALGDVAVDSPANAILEAADRVLTDALAVARREANDEPLTADETAALAKLPDRLAALEASLVGSRAADASLAVDVHTDLGSARALVEACGDLDDVYAAVREPGTGRLVLAVGATASHYEVTEHARDRPTDTVWRARLHGPSPPARADYTRAYLVVPPPPPEPADVADASAD